MTKVVEILKEEFRRRMIEEGLSRIEKCFSLLTEDQIWHKENENSNSMGNIVLHLCGNITQYIHSGIGGKKDERQRVEEFKISSRVDSIKLLTKIQEVVQEANRIVSNLEPIVFSEDRKVQGFDENVTSIVVHVIEHYSYHIGQLTYFTKFISNQDTGYYAGLDLNITS